MSTGIIVLLFVLGFGLVALSMVLRAKSGGKYEIKTIDLVMALIPLVVWLVATGKVQKLAIGGMEIETAAAFVGASSKPIEAQVTKTESVSIREVVDSVARAGKGGVDVIPRLIEAQIEALEFQLGSGRYYGPAIRQYFDALGAYPYLNYIVLNHRDGTLFGIYDARLLLGYLRERGREAYREFATRINRGDASALRYLERLPGFVPEKFAVTADVDKRFVLARMEQLDRERLPVVDARRRFVGVVDRSRLTASLIIDVAEKLEAIKP